MDIKPYFDHVEKEVILFLGATLVAFISWLVKGIVEKPIDESKVTFNKFFEKRIEMLTEIKTLLHFIIYFPKIEDSKDFKQKIQDLYLKDGKSAYLNRELFEDILKISITPETDQKFVIETIKKLDEDLYSMISKIQDEIKFYRKFSNYDPIKRLLGFFILAMNYIFSLIIIVSVLGFAIYGIFSYCWFIKISIVIISLVIALITYKWIFKK